MERNLGELSYNPKTLIPMYSGQGPNQFWEFMQSKIRQNVVSACYNDALTVQQISLETGIPLPYLDDEIRALENRNIIIKDGNHYKANVIIITSECANEIDRAVTKYHEQIADKIEVFISNKMDEYKKVGFTGSEFSNNTLRWQFASILFRMMIYLYREDDYKMPKTGWGETAYLWCVENHHHKHVFNYCTLDGRQEDELCFFDYLIDGKGNHSDFYGNERYINIFCDICRGENECFGEYDLETIAEMIKKGYVIKENETYRATTLIYTFEQYNTIVNMVEEFISTDLASIIQEIEQVSAQILSAHTPKHLQQQVKGITSVEKFVNTVCAPASILIDRQFLNTVWHPLEMPTTYVILK